ncbi:MAG: hypothetical protein ACF8R7_06660, partial [Phycisphaerales bacterium JB039]
MDTNARFVLSNIASVSSLVALAFSFVAQAFSFVALAFSFVAFPCGLGGRLPIRTAIAARRRAQGVGRGRGRCCAQLSDHDDGDPGGDQPAAHSSARGRGRRPAPAGGPHSPFLWAGARQDRT